MFLKKYRYTAIVILSSGLLGLSGCGSEIEKDAADTVTDAVSEGAEAVTDAVSEGCLLYTSPSPRDQRGSRMPSSA